MQGQGNLKKPAGARPNSKSLMENSVLANKHKKTVRRKKNASLKWQPVPQALSNDVLSMLDDAISPFVSSSNHEVQKVLDLIIDRVQNNLKNLKVPKVKWADRKSLNIHKRNLLAKKKWLEELENTLSTALQEETWETAQLQAQVSRQKQIETK